MKLFFLIICGYLLAATAEAETFRGGAVFHSESTGGLVRIEGTGATCEGDVTRAKGGTVRCLLTVMTTGLKLRDTHMREKYLETLKFPVATLELEPLPAGEAFEWKGKLTIKMDTKPVTGQATLSAGGDLKTVFKFSLADFPSVGAPCFQKICVAGDVSVDVAGKVSRE